MGYLSEYVENGRTRIERKGVELLGRHRSKTEIPLEASLGEFVSPGKRVFTAMLRDIRERKREEERLRRAAVEKETLQEVADLVDFDERVEILGKEGIESVRVVRVRQLRACPQALVRRSSS